MTLSDVIGAMRSAGCSEAQIGATVVKLTDCPRKSNAEHQAAFRARKAERKALQYGLTISAETPDCSTRACAPAGVEDNSLPLEITGKILRKKESSSLGAKKDPINGHRTEIVDQFVAGWDAIAAYAGLPVCRSISQTRETHIVARSRDLVEVFGFPEPQAGFLELFARIRGSPFLLGRTANKFRCDLDWITNETNFIKIMEGKYEPETKQIDFLKR